MANVNDIPGLGEIINSLDPLRIGDLQEFVDNLWLSQQGQTVPKPNWITIIEANAITSCVLEYRQRLMDKEFPVAIDIKKVAEIRGSRFNTGKTRFDLLDWEALQGLADILAFGAQKYAAYNWKKGLPYMEIIASMLRHIAEITRGEDIDPETGKPHADHIQCNAMFLSWMMKNRPDMDDRHKS